MRDRKFARLLRGNGGNRESRPVPPDAILRTSRHGLAVRQPRPVKLRCVAAAEPSAADDAERGSASVLAVTGMGVLAVMAMLGLGWRVVAERRSVEDSLAELRAYWGAMGQATYVLSRMRGENKVDDVKGAAEKYLQEIADGAKNKQGTATWYYPEVTSAYAIVSDPDAKAGNGLQQGTGTLTFSFSTLTAPVPPEALRTVPDTPSNAAPGLRKLQVVFCVTDALGICVPNPDKNTAGLTRILAVHRVPGP